MRDDQPSITARSVALARSNFERPTLPSGDVDVEERLVDDLRHDENARRRGSFLAVRTRFVDEAVIDAVTGLTGLCSQVVVVGAGYDARSSRYRSPGVRFFELDHPATQTDKLRRLHELAVDTSDVTYLAIDLIDADVAEVLDAGGYRDDEPTLFVCEGLVLYLPLEVTQRMFTTMSERSPRGSQLVASMPLADPTQRREGFERRVSAIGEDVLSRFTRDEVVELFTSTGWDPSTIADAGASDSAAPSGRALLVRASNVRA
jgi:methyltransferase (TIGR00027 family)